MGPIIVIQGIISIIIRLRITTSMKAKFRINISVWLRNRLISVGLEPDSSRNEKSCITDNFPQIFLKITRLILVL